jgi:hypothetical protein
VPRATPVQLFTPQKPSTQLQGGSGPVVPPVVVPVVLEVPVPVVDPLVVPVPVVAVPLPDVLPLVVLPVLDAVVVLAVPVPLVEPVLAPVELPASLAWLPLHAAMAAETASIATHDLVSCMATPIVSTAYRRPDRR